MVFQRPSPWAIKLIARVVGKPGRKLAVAGWAAAKILAVKRRWNTSSTGMREQQ